MRAWTEILPLFICRWLALNYGERFFVFREGHGRIAAIGRPDVLFIVKPTEPTK